MEIKFKRDTSFRKQFFVPDSFAHPAKMDAQLLLWIVNKYSKEGETVLDPMAGSGTMMLACTLGRNVVLVELEEKFCKLMADNWEQVKMRPQLGSQMGSCHIIQGDARQLEGLCDKIITSPPYAESQVPPHTAEGEARRLEIVKERGVSPDKVSYLDYTKVDKIVTSPPYAEAHDKEPGGVTKTNRKDLLDYSYLKEDNPNNVGNLPYGQIDKIITSPPYEDAMDAGRHPLGHLHKAKRHFTQYGTDSQQIGNLKSDSYLEAMLQVYQQCHKVLRPQGLMILVTKNFIRNKQVVRLDTDTIKLCEQAGFTYLERHYRKLPSQSFWRIIYHQKHPEVEQILNEDVLVFTK